MEFNSDSSSNYKPHWLQGDGSSVSAATSGTNPAGVIQRISTSDATSNNFGSVIVDILDAGNTSKYKTFRCLGGLDNNGGGRIYMTSGLWMSTSAITQIKLTPGEGTYFKANSHFALYGIKA